MVAGTKKKLASAGQDGGYISVNQFAKTFNVSRDSIYKAIKAGRIAYLPFPASGGRSRVLIPASEVDRIRELTQPPKAAGK